MSGLASRPITQASGWASIRRRVVSPVPIPSSSTRSGAKGIAATACVLQLVVAGDLGADPLQVDLGFPVELSPSRNLVGEEFIVSPYPAEVRSCPSAHDHDRPVAPLARPRRGQAARAAGRARALRARRPDLRGRPGRADRAAGGLPAERRLRLPPPASRSTSRAPACAASSRRRSTSRSRPARSTRRRPTTRSCAAPTCVEDELDIGRWAHDATILALPTRFLCRPDCAGLCPVCGESLNDADPADHEHETATDPRWAALNELKLE